MGSWPGADGAPPAVAKVRTDPNTAFIIATPLAAVPARPFPRPAPFTIRPDALHEGPGPSFKEDLGRTAGKSVVSPSDLYWHLRRPLLILTV